MHQEESGILEASPGAIALLIVFFLVVTLGIEHGLHHLKHYLKRRNKHGLLTAVTNLSNELMLLGVASLLLTAIEPAVTKVCLPAESLMKPWLSNVQGCACCLTRTEGVSHCFIEARQCPADFKQQCGVHPGPHRPLSLSKHTKYVSPEASPNTTTPPTEPNTAATGKRRLAASPIAASEAGQAPVPAEANSTSAAYSYDYGDEPTCAGSSEEAYEQCDYRPGYAPVITDATLEQVHMLLFIMAVLHIILSVMVLVASTFKLRHWAKINGGPSDDALALSALHYAAATTPAAPNSPEEPQCGSSLTGASRADRTPSKDVTDAAGLEPAVIVVSDEWAHRGADHSELTVTNWKGRSLEVQGPLGWLRECGINASRQLLLGLRSVVTQQEYSLLRATFYHNHNIHLLADGVASHSAEGTDKIPAAAAGDGQVELKGVHRASLKNVELSSAVSESKPQQQLGKQTLPQQQQQQQDTCPDQSIAQVQAGEADICQQRQQQQQEDPESSVPTVADVAIAGAAAAVKEAGVAEAAPPQSSTAASPVSVSAASAGVGLYAPYLLESVERDGSNVVGLGLPMWVLVIAFVLLSGAIGWATWLLLILAGALLLVINTSLIAAVRHVTRGGVVRQHDYNSWWLRHSRPLLAAVKLMLFFLSFVISNAVYFAAFFGPDSCFFSRTGFQRNPVPWYAVMIIDLGLLVSLALVTLPLYTLLTHTLRADKKLVAEMLQRQEQQRSSHRINTASH